MFAVWHNLLCETMKIWKWQERGKLNTDRVVVSAQISKIPFDILKENYLLIRSTDF